MENILLEDARILAEDPSIPWPEYEGKTIAVTGATGLIGKTIVSAMLAHNEVSKDKCSVLALVRNPGKAKEAFGNRDDLSLIPWDATSPNKGIEDIHPDFVIHCANVTDSSSFVERPVETVDITLGGARAMLDLSLRSEARFCLLSTMETYGEVTFDDMITENRGGFLDAMSVRNSYPEAKRLAEMLSAAYSSEYGASTVVVRLVQTMGPGVPVTDRRVFAEFARCALESRDIILLTEGTKQNSYLYTRDAASAILIAAAKGTSGTAYNAANDDSFCSVREMAEMVASGIGEGKISVKINLDSKAAQRFRKGNVLRLDSTRLVELGWNPQVNLPEMYQRMVAAWQESETSVS